MLIMLIISTCYANMLNASQPKSSEYVNSSEKENILNQPKLVPLHFGTSEIPGLVY